MKKLNYARYLILKEWLPLIIVFAAVAIMGSLLNVAFMDLYFGHCNELSSYFITIPMVILAIILPYFVFDYRYSLKRSDTYYQIPAKPGEIRRVRVVTGLIVLVAVVTIAFVLAYVALIVRYFNSPKQILNPYHEQLSSYDGYFPVYVDRSVIDFKLMMIVYLIAISLIVIEYFISCFFTSLASKPASALMINIAYHAIIVFTMYGFFNLLSSISMSFEYDLKFYRMATISFTFSTGPGIAVNLPEIFMHAYALHSESESLLYKGAYLFTFIFSIVLEIVTGIAAAVLTFIRKDSSGECCNNYGFANKKYNSLFFLSMIPMVVFFIDIGGMFNPSNLFIVVILAAMYYFFFVLFMGTFKIPVHNYVIIAIFAVVMTLGQIIIPAMNN